VEFLPTFPRKLPLFSISAFSITRGYHNLRMVARDSFKYRFKISGLGQDFARFLKTVHKMGLKYHFNAAKRLKFGFRLLCLACV